MYYTYMLRCEDNTIYTGITTDLQRRMKEHFNKEKTCAKYTKRHNAKKLEIAIESKTRVDASKLEYHLKTLTKSQKEKVIDNINKLEIYLGKKIECEKYKKININVLEKEG